METFFTKTANKQYQDWRTSDKKKIKRINELINDIEENGVLNGIGKPEQLKHFDVPTYSRRIDDKNRLVYRQRENNDLVILACKGHYDDIH